MGSQIYTRGVAPPARPRAENYHTWKEYHYWHQKTRDTGLPDGEDRISLRSLVLTQYRSVTDRQKDGRTYRSMYSACGGAP